MHDVSISHRQTERVFKMAKNKKLKKNYGEEMRLVRVHLKRSLKGMAEILGVHPATLSAYEKGRCPPVQIYDAVMDMKKEIGQTMEM